jgi:hypothetical protein
MTKEKRLNEYRIVFKLVGFVETQERYFNARSAEMAKKSFYDAQEQGTKLDHEHISVWDRFLEKWCDVNSNDELIGISN